MGLRSLGLSPHGSGFGTAGSPPTAQGMSTPCQLIPPASGSGSPRARTRRHPRPRTRPTNRMAMAMTTTTTTTLTNRSRCPAVDENGYSMRMPLIARAITSCWISDVPSKIVWFSVPGLLGVDECCSMPLGSGFADVGDGSCQSVRPILGTLGISRPGEVVPENPRGRPDGVFPDFEDEIRIWAWRNDTSSKIYQDRREVGRVTASAVHPPYCPRVHSDPARHCRQPGRGLTGGFFVRVYCHSNSNVLSFPTSFSETVSDDNDIERGP